MEGGERKESILPFWGRRLRSEDEMPKDECFRIG
jgi:hypothetical protein